MFPPHIDYNDVELTILKDKTDLSKFQCDLGDVSGVNDFYRDEALKYQKDQLGVTYVFYYNEKIIACLTVSMNSIKFKEAPDFESINHFRPKHPPVLYIGQLGVHNESRGRRVGQHVINTASALATIMTNIIGCRYLALHCHRSLAGYYSSKGFQTVSDERKEDWLMVRQIVPLDIDPSIILEKLMSIQLNQNIE